MVVFLGVLSEGRQRADHRLLAVHPLQVVVAGAVEETVEGRHRAEGLLHRVQVRLLEEVEEEAGDDEEVVQAWVVEHCHHRAEGRLCNGHRVLERGGGVVVGEAVKLLQK